MEGIQELCVVDIVMGTKLQCATLSISIGNSCNEKLIYREGELRMSKKVGGGGSVRIHDSLDRSAGEECCRDN